MIFIGLGYIGTQIIMKLKEEGYSGIMIDCSYKNMRTLGTKTDQDYYLMGEKRGTGGNRKLGKTSIEKEIWMIYDEFKKWEGMKNIIVFSYSDSGVSGGVKTIVEEVKERFKEGDIYVLSIICTTGMRDTLINTLDVYKENKELKKNKLIREALYIEWREKELSEIKKNIVDLMLDMINASSGNDLKEISDSIEEHMSKYEVFNEGQIVPKILFTENNLLREKIHKIGVIAESGKSYIEEVYSVRNENQYILEKDRERKFLLKGYRNLEEIERIALSIEDESLDS